MYNIQNHPVYEPTFLNLDILYKLFEPSAHCSHKIWHQLDHRTNLSANWNQFTVNRTEKFVMHFRRFDPGPTDSQNKTQSHMPRNAQSLQPPNEILNGKGYVHTTLCHNKSSINFRNGHMVDMTHLYPLNVSTLNIDM